MKKHWRCHVCNDIHYGIAPPLACPTCQIKNAYVEISPEEAGIMAPPDSEKMAKEGFLQSIQRFVESNEFRINPDKERVDTLLEGIFNNEHNHGLKFCPCRLNTKNREEDLKLVCPCNFRIHETYKDKKDGECWCGLFVRRRDNE